MMKKGLRVGVSLFVRKGEQSLWENGIFQNCLFLVMLLLKSELVASVVLVAGGGDGEPDDALRFIPDSPVAVIDMATAGQTLDVMVEMSAQLARDWMEAFRDRGGKTVSMRVGNDYVIDIERMMFNRPHGLLITGAPYDAVWSIPEYRKTSVPYFRSAFRAPTRIVPHLWSPVILERALKQLPSGQSFDYQPGRKRWRVAMFEPNICMVKTSHISLLCCEGAHRRNPELLEHVYAYNTWHMREQLTFNGFANSLDIVRHELTSFEGRFPTWQVMSTNIDAVVSHHWENGQNYSYYEALYGGYPLIHNTHLLGGCGYHYNGFDCEEGAAALQRAFVEHDLNFASYRDKANSFLETLDPVCPDNVLAYNEALSDLFN